jgi:hypothetical protein
MSCCAGCRYDFSWNWTLAQRELRLARVARVDGAQEMTPYPEWLHVLSWAYLGLSFACAAYIAFDEIRRPQKMIIMNFVWPITALYFGPVAVWSYLHAGLKMTRSRMRRMQRMIREELKSENGRSAPAENQPARPQPTGEQIAVGVSHCGAGCTLGDISAEWWVFVMGLAFAGGDFSTRLIMDFLLAWTFGIAFQYFTIAPMRGLPLGKGILQAMRVDTFSIVAFQLGLFAWMALSYFVFFPAPHLRPDEAVFWFMMQVGMIIGFFTSYPANRFLLSNGWKEKMPQSKAEMKRMIQEQQLRPRAA